MSTFRLTTTRFGELELPETALLVFEQGLLGFEHLTRFVIIESDDADPMRWLQAVDEEDIAFLIVEPALFFPDYTVKLTQEDRQALKLGAKDEALLACLVVVPEDASQMTINLLGPLAMNAEARVGRQLVLHDSGHSPRQRLLPDPAPEGSPAVAV